MHFLLRFKTWLAQLFFRKQSVARNQSELVERLSHELRTSLTGIVGYSEFVESNSTEPMVNFTAKIIRESSQILARVSNAFFDLHRLNEQQLNMECSVFSFKEKVYSLVKLYQERALEKNANLLFDCSDDASLLDMYADIQRIRQIVDALLHWAVQSIEADQSIHVDISLAADKRFFIFSIVFSSKKNNTENILFRDFWNNSIYKFRLQEGPGVELALAKALIYFLQGTTEYQVASDESTRLIVNFPISYGSIKVIT